MEKGKHQPLTAELLNTLSNGLVTNMLSRPADHNLWLRLIKSGEELTELAQSQKVDARDIRGMDLNWRMGIDAAHIMI